MKQNMVVETVDSILVKEGMVEIIFLFHSKYLISQCCFCKKNMIPYTLKIYDFLLVFRFLSRKKKIVFDLKRVESVFTLSGILTIHIYFGRKRYLNECIGQWNFTHRRSKFQAIISYGYQTVRFVFGVQNFLEWSVWGSKCCIAWFVGIQHMSMDLGCNKVSFLYFCSVKYCQLSFTLNLVCPLGSQFWFLVKKNKKQSWSGNLNLLFNYQVTNNFLHEL